jgi:signal transduction histidine kinase/CheY-like chemotaxis protein
MDFPPSLCSVPSVREYIIFIDSDSEITNTPDERDIMLYKKLKELQTQWNIHFHSSKIKNNKIVPLGVNYKSPYSCLCNIQCLYEIVNMQTSFYQMLDNVISSREKMYNLNQKKQQFVRYLFHELRNPLNTINLAVEAIQKDDKKYSNDDSIETINLIYHQGQAMARIINDTLLLLKNEDKALKLEYAPFSIHSMIIWVAETLKYQLAEKKIQFSTSIQSVSVFAFGVTANDHLNIPKVDVIGDKYKLRQVLINLLSNAIKFTPIGGKIEIIMNISILSPTLVETAVNTERSISGGFFKPLKLQSDNLEFISADSPKMQKIENIPESHTLTQIHKCGHFKISVIDTGIGIPPHLRSQLFVEPYMQIIPAQLQQGKGTGLGLNISRSIIELHGGRIGYNVPQSGIGSEFYFTLDLNFQLRSLRSISSLPRRLNPKGLSLTLPMSPTSNLSSGAITPFHISITPPTDSNNEKKLEIDTTKSYHSQIFNVDLQNIDDYNAKNYKILIAEDSEATLKLMLNLVSRLGYNATGVSNGELAVQKFREAKVLPFDLILMDGNMPVKDGIVATRELRALGLTIPIIAVTGNAIQSDIEIFMRAGANDYLIKPINIKDLSVILKQYLK